MTSRAMRFTSRDDDERTKLLHSDEIQDDYEVRKLARNLELSFLTVKWFFFQIRFSNQPYEHKKRTRKHSDEISSFALVDVGNAPDAPPLDQCVEAEVMTIRRKCFHIDFSIYPRF